MRLSIGNVEKVSVDLITKQIEIIDSAGKTSPIKSFKSKKRIVDQGAFIGIFPEIELSKKEFLTLLSCLNNENNSYAYRYESLNNKYIVT